MLNTTEQLLFEKCGENEPNHTQTYNSFVAKANEDVSDRKIKSEAGMMNKVSSAMKRNISRKFN